MLFGTIMNVCLYVHESFSDNCGDKLISLVLLLGGQLNDLNEISTPRRVIQEDGRFFETAAHVRVFLDKVDSGCGQSLIFAFK
jgi:hypothetical protein